MHTVKVAIKATLLIGAAGSYVLMECQVQQTSDYVNPPS